MYSLEILLKKGLGEWSVYRIRGIIILPEDVQDFFYETWDEEETMFRVLYV